MIESTVALTAAHCKGDAINGQRIVSFIRLSDTVPGLDLAVVKTASPVNAGIREIDADTVPRNLPRFTIQSATPIRKGNSGSPVLVDGRIAGILGQRIKGQPKTGIAVNVSRYADWIKSVIN